MKELFTNFLMISDIIQTKDETRIPQKLTINTINTINIKPSSRKYSSFMQHGYFTCIEIKYVHTIYSQEFDHL